MRSPAARTTRRTLLALGGAAAAASWLPEASAASVEEPDVTELRRRMTDGRLDAVRLTRCYLDRIRHLDPLLHAVVEVNPDALREARRLDAEARPRGPLHGIPVLLKDLVETADRMHTTAGSLALEGLRPAKDATVAARLRAAGAVILGKTNLSEWAGGLSLTHHAGWSARGGQTRNPYKLDRSPNESSSGTAAGIPTAERLEDLPSSMVVQAYEVKRGLNAYLAAAPGDHPRGLAELIAFNRAHAGRELRYVRQDGLEAVHGLDFGEREYREALATKHRLSRAEGIDAALRRHRLDALMMPTTGPPAKIDLVRGDTYGGGSSTPAALAGYPAVSVPAGFAFGLPVGLTFMGTAWSEPVLLRLAYAYEQASGVRRPPEYRPADIGF